MSHSCPNLVSTSFLYNPYIPFLICRNFLFTSIIIWLRSVYVSCNRRYARLYKMIYGPFFLVRFKTVGVKLEAGFGIKISVTTQSRD